MAFDFDAAVTAPFRMQPGLRRLAAGTAQLTPLAPGSKHQREKLAVLSAYWSQALCALPGFDADPALDALYTQAAQEHPGAWAWDGQLAVARRLGCAVHADGEVIELQPGAFGLGDEIARCLQGLPAAWRQVGLASLAFAEDFAIVDAASGTLPWMAVALPSHWAPEEKVGRHFTEVHGPVADNERLLRASAGLLQLAAGPQRWERFVWNVSDHPRLHAHPARVDPQRWLHTPVARAWWRTEHQSFIPLPQAQQALFLIHVQVQTLDSALCTPQRAAALHAAIASMGPAVLAYRQLAAVRDELLAWLAERAGMATNGPSPAAAPTP